MRQAQAVELHEQHHQGGDQQGGEDGVHQWALADEQQWAGLGLAGEGGTDLQHAEQCQEAGQQQGQGGGVDSLVVGRLVGHHLTALQNGVIAGAGLDVYQCEPEVPAALLELDNAVLLPHVGSASVETRQQMADLVLDNLRCFIASGQLLTPL